MLLYSPSKVCQIMVVCRILHNLMLKTDLQNGELVCLWPYLICIIQCRNCVKIHKAKCSLFLVNFNNIFVFLTST